MEANRLVFGCGAKDVEPALKRLCNNVKINAGAIIRFGVSSGAGVLQFNGKPKEADRWRPEVGASTPKTSGRALSSRAAPARATTSGAVSRLRQEVVEMVAKRQDHRQ